MGYFGNKLAELIAVNQTSQSELAKRTGLSQAHISRLISDDQRAVSLEDLKLISVNLTAQPFQRAELVRAHLLDRCHGPGSDLIEIRIAGENSSGVRPGPVPLPAKIERVFERLRANYQDKRLQTILEGLAALYEESVNSSADTVPAGDTEHIAVESLKAAGRRPARATAHPKQ